MPNFLDWRSIAQRYEDDDLTQTLLGNPTDQLLEPPPAAVPQVPQTIGASASWEPPEPAPLPDTRVPIQIKDLDIPYSQKIMSQIPVPEFARDVAEIGGMTAQRSAKSIYDLGAGAIRAADQNPLLWPATKPAEALADTILPESVSSRLKPRNIADWLQGLGENVATPRPEAVGAMTRHPIVGALESSILGAGPAIAEYSVMPGGPATSMALIDFLRSKGSSAGPLEQGVAAAKGLLVGKMLGGLQPYSRPVRSAGMGTLMGAQTAIEGGSPTEVLTSVVTGGGLGAAGAREGITFKEGISEAVRPAVERVGKGFQMLMERIRPDVNKQILEIEGRMAAKAGLDDAQMEGFLKDSVMDGVRYRRIADGVRLKNITEDQGVKMLSDLVSRPRPTGELEAMALEAKGAGNLDEFKQTNAGQRLTEDVKAVAAAAKEAQTELDGFVRDRVSDVAREIKGNVKSEDSIVAKVYRKQAEKPGYYLDDLSDLAREAVIVDRPEQMVEVVRRLSGPEAELDVNLTKPMNQFGYRGIHVTRKMSNGLTAEVQIHTPESWALKKRSDAIYRKWRNENTLQLTGKTHKEYVRDMEWSQRAWADYSAPVAGLEAPMIEAASSAETGLESMKKPTVMPFSGGVQEPVAGSQTSKFLASTSRPSPAIPSQRSEGILSPLWERLSKPTRGVKPGLFGRLESSRGSFSSKPNEPIPEGIIFASPNIEEGVGFDGAVKRIHSDEQARFKAVSKEADAKEGLKSTMKDAIGDWNDPTYGADAENSTITLIDKVSDYAVQRKVAAIRGLDGNQKSILSFRADENGPDAVYRISIDNSTADMVVLRQALDEAGLHYRTLAPEKGMTEIYIFDQGKSLVKEMEAFSERFKTNYRIRSGTGEFIGGSNRAEGRRAFEEILGRPGRRALGRADNNRPSPEGRIPEEGSVEPPEVPGLETFTKLAEERGSFTRKPTEPPKEREYGQPAELEPGTTIKKVAGDRTMEEAETLSGTYLQKAAEKMEPAERKAAEAMFKKEAKNIAEARKYKRTWAMVEKEAAAMGVSFEKNGDIYMGGKKIEKGQPLTDVQTELMGRINRRAEQDLARAADYRDKHPTDPKANAEFDEALTTSTILTNRLYGHRANPGRSLNLYKKLMTPGDMYERRVIEFMRSQPVEMKDQIMRDIKQAQLEGKRLLAKGKNAQEAAVPLRNVMNKYVTSTFTQKFAEFVTMAKLTSPITHVRNILGNAVFAVTKPVERIFSAAADVGPALIRKIRGKGGREVYFGEAPAEAFGQIMAMKQGFKEAWTVIKTGIVAGTKGEEVQLFRPAIKGVTGEVIRVPGRLLGAMDAFFKPWARNGVRWSEAYRAASKAGIRPGSGKFLSFVQDFMKNLPENIKEKMQAEALTRLYQAPMTGMAKSIGEFRSKHPILRVVGLLFWNTPVNILKEATKRTPAAIVMPSVWHDLRAGGAEASEAMGRITMGSAFITSAVVAALAGQIDLTPPMQDKDERTMTGRPPSSIKIGDTWYSYLDLEPVSTILTWAATVLDSVRHSDRMTTEQIAKDFAVNNYRNMMQKSFMQGMNDLMDVIDDPEKGKSFFGKVATLPIPTLSGYLARNVDPTVRENKTIAQTVGRQIPFVSEAVPPKLDAYGEPMKYAGSVEGETGLGRGLKSLSPTTWWKGIFRPEKESDDPVKQELSDLYQESGAKVTMPPRTYRGIKLDTDEYNEMLSQTGPEIKDRIWAFVNNEESVVLHRKGNNMFWDDMDLEERRSAVQKLVNAARDEYRGEDENGDTFIDRIIQDRLDNMGNERDQKAFLKGLWIKKHLKKERWNYWLEYIGAEGSE